MIAFCGLNCKECPAYKATQKDDQFMRAKVAEEWSKEYKATIEQAEINCDGCMTEGGRLFSHCRVCEIRKCGQDKSVENCGHCSEYPCSRLSFVTDAVPEAKDVLDQIKHTK